MTTVIATRRCLVADKKVSAVSVFRTTKIFRINGNLIGSCGGMAECIQFAEWYRKREKKPVFTDGAFEALELSSKGKLFYWGTDLTPIPVEEEFYAIGSGAHYALGAMAMGASPKKAIQIASKWDEATGSEAQTMTIKGLP